MSSKRLYRSNVIEELFLETIQQCIEGIISLDRDLAGSRTNMQVQGCTAMTLARMKPIATIRNAVTDLHTVSLGNLYQ